MKKSIVSGEFIINEYTNKQKEVEELKSALESLGHKIEGTDYFDIEQDKRLPVKLLLDQYKIKFKELDILLKTTYVIK